MFSLFFCIPSVMSRSRERIGCWIEPNLSLDITSWDGGREEGGVREKGREKKGEGRRAREESEKGERGRREEGGKGRKREGGRKKKGR